MARLAATVQFILELNSSTRPTASRGGADGADRRWPAWPPWGALLAAFAARSSERRRLVLEPLCCREGWEGRRVGQWGWARDGRAGGAQDGPQRSRGGVGAPPLLALQADGRAVLAAVGGGGWWRPRGDVGVAVLIGHGPGVALAGPATGWAAPGRWVAQDRLGLLYKFRCTKSPVLCTKWYHIYII